MPLSDRFKMGYLGWRIKQCYQNADIISAESQDALDSMRLPHGVKSCVSLNGANEIVLNNIENITSRDNIAVVVGTYRYKALNDAYSTFKGLQRTNPALKLMIIGDEKIVPAHLKNKAEVKLLGALDHADVIRYLLKARYYISTTLLENSSNANLEGVYLAEESYLSDIGPHRELLDGMHYEEVSIPHLNRPLLYVKKNNLSMDNLKCWDEVIQEMLMMVGFDKKKVIL